MAVAGAYEAARDIYDAVEGVVRAHVDVHGKNARVHITGHSIGGSLAMVLALMLILRGAADKKHVADVWIETLQGLSCGHTLGPLALLLVCKPIPKRTAYVAVLVIAVPAGRVLVNAHGPVRGPRVFVHVEDVDRVDR